MPILGGGLDITVEVRSPTLPLASGPVGIPANWATTD